MRIAITADPFIPVPPHHYGGIERIIDFLVRGLIARGHDVLLVAHKDSTIDAPLLAYPDGKGHSGNIISLSGLRHFNPDIIHSFSRLAYLLPFMRSPVPKLMSYQREPTIRQVKLAKMLIRSLSFTGCSNYISDKIRPYADVETVYNGLDMTKFTFRERVSPDAPLLFLGRIEFIKGTHIAIKVAKRAGKRLVIAGNIPENEQRYFADEIQPHLDENVEYAGPVNDEEKSKLLGKGLALLMPIQWNEPFGIVMVEAMACGTPVIGFGTGAVPEVIQNDLNGFVCANEGEMIDRVHQINQIDRTAVFEDCQRRFSADAIVDHYLSIYEKLVTT
ncbi:glycosyltransferase [Mucilaginibacter calamicampi]|uniref:Glycosyltransferase n=1 Tax=Mucilaginibacter calamicampi TaxID=1302352 RepID=A0ABW2YTJ1_9SPHI